MAHGSEIALRSNHSDSGQVLHRIEKAALPGVIRVNVAVELGQAIFDHSKEVNKKAFLKIQCVEFAIHFCPLIICLQNVTKKAASCSRFLASPRRSGLRIRTAQSSS